MFRGSAELMWKDLRDRSFRLHENVARVAQPGLLQLYLRSAPRGSAFRVFTDAWGKAAVTGVAGTGATWLPSDRLTTFELFDMDAAGPAGEWKQKLRQQLDAGTTRVVVNHGRHSDAVRLSFQRRRATTIKTLIGEIHSGTEVDNLTHPIDSIE